MKVFLKKCSLLFSFVFLMNFAATILYYVFMAPQYKYSYNASFQDKISRLQSIKEPKIILVGNSNVAFGIDSKMLEAEFKMPVVNLGLHGGLGNAFHENMAKFNIGAGDIVVICHSSYSDDDKINDPELALLTLDNFFEGWKVFRTKDIPELLKAFPRFIFKSIKLYIFRQGNKEPTDCYTRLGFNENGDLVYPRVYDKNLFDPNSKADKSKINDTCINRINNFNSYCEKLGATLLIAGYPILERDGDDSDITFYRNFSKELQGKLNCPVISDFSDYILDEKYFYNTVLHLTNEGAEKRTRQLVLDLRDLNVLKK